MGGEGQGPLPVEREDGGDRLVEAGRAGGGVVALGAPEAEPLGRLRGPAAEAAGDARHAGHPGVDQDPVGVDPPQAGAEAVVGDDQDARAAASASSQSSPIARSRPAITEWAAALKAGSSIPVSSTFR